MNGNDPPEYLLYLRKSNGRKAVPRQRAITTGYITKQGGVILEEFSDADRTAFRRVDGEQPRRDEFARMLGVLRARRGLRVAAWHADRLTRNDQDTAELIRVCAAGAHLVETPSGGVYDLSTANGRKRLRDDASNAIYEVDHNTERVLAARDEVAADGRWLGGKRPFGWELDGNPVGEDGEPLLDEDGEPVNGILQLREDEAKALRDAHRAVLDNVTTYTIAAQWNAAGLRGTMGAPWTPREVARVLLRPRNAGLMEHRGQITGKASWPAIVDEETWQAVRAKLTDPGRRTTPGPGRRHLLSGLALCGVCGAPLISSSTRSKQGLRTVYRCRGTDGKTHVARDEATLDTFIVRLTVERLSMPDADEMMRQDTSAELDALRREKAAVETLMKEANELRIDGLLTAAEFRDGRRKHQARLEEIEEKMTAAMQSDVLTPVMVRFAEEAPEDYENLVLVWEEFPLDTRRAIIDTLMTIRVMPSPKGRPKGWRPGESYFASETVAVELKRDFRPG